MNKIFFTLVLGSSLLAQSPSDENDLLALLNTPVTVASSKARSLRESPGVISYITRDEIQASGARNIVDVLRLIPGFQVAYDTQGSLGLSTRGFWSYEGKALILWNDIELNELLYGTVSMADTYPIDQIKRVEIIRGPGSALYGGFAELAVIKIVTVDAQEIKPIAGSIAYGRTEQGDHDKQIGAVYSKVHNGVNYTVGAAYSNNSYGAASTTAYLNFSNENLVFNGFALNQTIQNPEYPYPTPTLVSTKWLNQSFSLKYKFDMSDVFSLTPYVKYVNSTPWISQNDDGGYIRRNVERMKFGATANVDLDNWHFGFGAERYLDNARVGAETNVPTYLTPDNRTEVTYSNNALFAEVEYSGVVNITVGGRYENHSYAGEKFVPRFGITKAFDTWHVKVLYAEAFRTPNVLNIGKASPFQVGNIEPETTKTYEVELGKQLGRHFFTLNGYSTELEKPLVWVGGYYNGPSMKVKGLEMDYRFKATWGFVNASYTFMSPNNLVPDWQVPGDESHSLGLANQQGKLVVNITPFTALDFGGSLVYSGERYAYNMLGEVQQYDPKLLTNLNATLKLGKYAVMFGVYDVFDQKELFMQTYAGGIPTITGRGTEYYIKLKYGF